MGIEDWKVKDSYGNVLAQILTFTPALDPSIVSFKGLDGSFYLQSFGEPGLTASVTVLSTFDEMWSLNECQAYGGSFTVTYRDSQFVAYLPEKPQWKAEKPGYYYSATLNFTLMRPDSPEPDIH